jgi:periplasmic protein TonB
MRHLVLLALAISFVGPADAGGFGGLVPRPATPEPRDPIVPARPTYPIAPPAPGTLPPGPVNPGASTTLPTPSTVSVPPAPLPSQPALPPSVTLTLDPAAPVVEQPRRVSGTPPEYPSRAAQRGIGGFAILEFTVGVDGRVSDLVIAQQDPPSAGFGEAARSAVRNWRFPPNGAGIEAQPYRARLRLSFVPPE